MKKIKILVTMALIVSIQLSAVDYGAKGAEVKSDFTLGEMLLYALQDEHLALAEYNAIMEHYGVDRPYANIAKAEKTHISYVEALYAEMGWSIPVIDADAHVVLPSSLQEAAEIGVKAEIDNIGMYEKFLAQELPENVREVFVDLKESSEKHLSAFERQLDRNQREGMGRRRS